MTSLLFLQLRVLKLSSPNMPEIISSIEVSTVLQEEIISPSLKTLTALHKLIISSK